MTIELVASVVDSASAIQRFKMHVVDDRWVYVKGEGTGARLGQVAVWDLADPTNPVLATRWIPPERSPGLPDYLTERDSVFDGSRYLYVPAGGAKAGFYVVDLNVRNAPSLVTHWYNPSTDFRFACYGYDPRGYMIGGFYTSGGGYIAYDVYDVSNPALPVRAGYWTSGTPAAAGGGEVWNGRLYNAHSYRYAFDVLDLNTPTAPSLVGAIGGITAPHEAALDRDRSLAFAVSSFSGSTIVCYDVSNPTAPTELSRIGGATNRMQNNQSLFVLNDHVVTAGPYVAELDYADPSVPVLFDYSAAVIPGAGDVAIRPLGGGEFYVVAVPGYLHVYRGNPPVIGRMAVVRR